MKRFLTVTVLAAILALPFGAQAAKDSLVLGMRLEPPALDPTMGAAAAITQITLLNVYEGLTRIDESGKVLPLLAESWTVSDDAKTYTFKLVQGVKFHDGSDFDSADVKFTFERNGGKDSTNKRKKNFAAMTVTAPDPQTVVISLQKPHGLMLFDLARASAVIVGSESAATNATNPVGTGPYKFDKWVKGDSVTLVKNPDYRNAANVKISSVKFRFMGDPSAQVSALMAGDVDYFPGISAPEMLEQFKQNPDFQVLEGTTEGETILSTNNKRPPLDDVRVRRAIAHAINRQEIIDGAMYGYGTPIGTHFAPHNPAYVDLTGAYPYDPAKAKALLAEAGQSNLTVSLKLPPPSYARRGGEIIAAQLAKAGITANIEQVEWAQWLDVVYKKKNYDLTIVSHVEPMDIDIYARDSYYFQYDSAEFRDIIDKANSATNPADQNKWYAAAQRKLSEDAVNGFLFQLAKAGVARKGLQGTWKNWPMFINDVAAMSWAN